MENVHKTYVFPGTKSVFFGSEALAEENGYVGLVDEDFEALMAGTKTWEEGELVDCEAEEETDKFPLTYKQKVAMYVRERYSQNDAEAILANYLADTSNEEHAREFAEFQSYREQCKARASQ